MAGDAAADLRAGRDAGVRTVACLWGAGRREALARQAPWRTVTCVGELTVLLDGLTAGAVGAGAGGTIVLAPATMGAGDPSARLRGSDG